MATSREAGAGLELAIRGIMPPGVGAIYKVSLIALLVAAGGCPGQYTGSTNPSKPDHGGVSFTDLPPSTRADGGKPQPVSLDLKAPDHSGPVLTPDKSPPTPDQPPPNGNCPCPATQLCISNKCYTKCTPTGGCGADSTCAATELCILVTGANVNVCMAATGTLNGPCAPTGPWCPNHLVCAVKSGATQGTCRPQCTGGQCPGGGTCNQYQSCLFCI